MTFSVSDNFSNPDFRVLIGENVGFADIEIQFGTNVSFENFTVRMTEFASKADFIITDRTNADFTIAATNEINSPDLIIEAKEKSLEFVEAFLTKYF